MSQFSGLSIIKLHQLPVGLLEVLQALVRLSAERVVRPEPQVLLVVHGRGGRVLAELRLLEPADLGGEPGTQLVVGALHRAETVPALKEGNGMLCPILRQMSNTARLMM